MWETGSLNWAQFMLQWFIRLPEFEFTEFSESSVPFRKNSIGSAAVLCANVCISIYTILKDHSHERQRLRVRLRLRLRQDDNIVAMKMLRQTQRMGVEPILYIWRNGLRNILQFKANAHADANIDARVNGPLNSNSNLKCEQSSTTHAADSNEFEFSRNTQSWQCWQLCIA